MSLTSELEKSVLQVARLNTLLFAEISDICASKQTFSQHAKDILKTLAFLEDRMHLQLDAVQKQLIAKNKMIEMESLISNSTQILASCSSSLRASRKEIEELTRKCKNALTQAEISSDAQQAPQNDSKPMERPSLLTIVNYSQRIASSARAPPGWVPGVRLLDTPEYIPPNPSEQMIRCGLLSKQEEAFASLKKADTDTLVVPMSDSAMVVDEHFVIDSKDMDIDVGDIPEGWKPGDPILPLLKKQTEDTDANVNVEEEEEEEEEIEWE